MSIVYREDSRSFYLHTKNTTYAFFVNELDALEHLYYGGRLSDEDLRYSVSRHGYSFTPYRQEIGCTVSPDGYLQEVSMTNSGDYRLSSISLKNAHGYYGARLFYKEYRQYTGRKPIEGMPYSHGDGAETLEIVLENETSGVRVTLYYVVYADLDVIARYQTIENLMDGELHLQKAATALDLYGHDYDRIDLFGLYHYERSYVDRQPLTFGTQGNHSTKGTTGHETNPFFALCAHDATEDHGDVYGFNLVYSGNFANEIQVDKVGNTRVVTGMSDYQFDWVLKRNETFTSPESILTYTDRGIGEMSRIMHDFVRAEILPKEFVYAHRPVVLNTWEAFLFDIDLKKIREVGEYSKKIGAELVVIDDGWFRNDDNEGLGDWKTIKEKFPNGIKEASDILHEQGLQFGLWFEPEMINERSELFVAHPEWVLGTLDEKYVARNQMVLDMGNPQVVDYLAGRIFDCLDGVPIEYLKWDMNRYISEVGSTYIREQGEVFHRYVLGVYDLMSRLRARYPHMMIENCSGGGGRFDLGMLYYSPQIWTSDNTDPYLRTVIQLGTSLAYPASSISCHYTHAKIAGIDVNEDLRFVSAAFGAYGYEMDPTAISAEEREKLMTYTQIQRRCEPIMLSGDLYRILHENDGDFASYIQVSKDKSSAVFTFIQYRYSPLRQELRVKLKGLQEDAYYRSSADGRIYQGATLMKVGLWMEGIQSVSGKAIQIFLDRCER